MELLNKSGIETTKTAAERRRIPMSVPVRKLEAPEIPGYHLHWFRGTPDRLQQALNGGYEFVNANEMHVNSVGLGSDTTVSGNTDMGSQVSVVAGGELDSTHQPIRLVLMKIKQEWYEEDQKLVENRSIQVAQALSGGLLGAENDRESGTRYVDKAKTSIPDLFKPKRPRAA